MAKSVWTAIKDGFKPQHKRMGVAQAKPNQMKFADRPADIRKRERAAAAKKGN